MDRKYSATACVYVVTVTILLGGVVHLPTAIAVTYFEDDIEPNPVLGWTNTSLWHLRNDTTTACGSPSSHSPNQSWWFGSESTCTYENGASRSFGNLTTPTIDLTATTPPITLTFWSWFETEPGAWDKMWVNISDDSWATWDTPLQIQDPLHQMEVWTEFEVNLSAHAGSSIEIMFSFDTGDEFANDYEGWLIDDIMIDDAPIVPDVLTIEAWNKSPAQVEQGQWDVVMLQLNLTANPDNVTVTSLRINLSGSPPDPNDIWSAELFLDADGNEKYDPVVDQWLATDNFPLVSPSSINFSFSGVLVSPGSTTKLFVIYHIAPGGISTPGDWVGVYLQNESYVGVLSPDTVSSANFPIDTYTPGVRTEIIAPTTDTLTLYYWEAKAPNTAMQWEMDVLMANMTLTVDSNSVTVESIELVLSGSPPLDTDVFWAKIFHDVNNNGVLDISVDELLGKERFDPVFLTALINLGSTGFTVFSTAPEQLLMVYDIAPDAFVTDFVGVSIPDNTYVNLPMGSSDMVASSGFPVETYQPGTRTEIIAGSLPTIYSSWTTAPPAIDGVHSAGEWSDATIVDLTAISVNELDALLLVKNDAMNLYFAYDAYGDTTNNFDDMAAISFDTDNNDAATNEADDQFVIGPPGAQGHYNYSIVAGSWTWDCDYDPGLPNHTTLAAGQGFGVSDFDPTIHRIYEWSIPLSLLDVPLPLPVDYTLGFSGSSVVAPGILDRSAFYTSTWPLFFLMPPPLAYYGDLILATGPNTAPVLSWTGEPNYVTDGLHPEIGATDTLFEYRVNYTDVDGNLPTATYPRIIIKKGGVDLINTTMLEVDPLDIDVTDGKWYNYSTILSNPGNDYEYCFNASDGLSWATGLATICQDSPDVIGNAPPSLSATSVNPVVGLAELTLFYYNVTYSDADNEPPAGTPLLWINKSGIPAQGSPLLTTWIDWVGSPNDYMAGAVYQHVTNITLPGNDYTFVFNVTDGRDGTYSIEKPGPIVNALPNNAPSLSNPTVTPPAGITGSTIFAYNVTYSDLDNDPPLSINVLVNKSTVPIAGSPFSLNPTGWVGGMGDYVAGAYYEYTTSLFAVGADYTYVFNASDGIDDVYSIEQPGPDVVAPPEDTLMVRGSDKAPATVNQGNTSVLMMNLTFVASSGSVTVTDIRVDRIGILSSDTDVAAVHLYDDLDGSADLTPGDVLLDTQTYVGGTVTFSGLFIFVDVMTPVSLLILYDISASAVPDHDVGVRIADNSYITVVPPDVVTSFPGLQSRRLIINGPPNPPIGLGVQGYADGTPGSLHITNHTPVLNWTFSDSNSGDTQYAYNVTVWDMPSGTGNLLFWRNVSSPATSSVYAGVMLLDGQTYYLRVMTADESNLWSGWAEMTFHLNALPPVPTEPVIPLNGASMPTSPTQTVSWSSGGPDPEGDTVVYYWEVALDTTFLPPAILSSGSGPGTISAAFATMPLVTYYWRVNASDTWELDPEFGNTPPGYWSFTTTGAANNPPTLTWTGESGYVTDGLEPESGYVDTSFVYRVNYMDVDNDAPEAGTPRVVILDGGAEALNATMIEVSPGDTDYTDGKFYIYTATLSIGTDFSYYFYARDGNGVLATGEATAPPVDAPDVLNRLPTLTWTGEAGYVADGVDPGSGDMDTIFTLRVDYTDLDDHAPQTGYPRVVILDDGLEIVNATMTEVNAGDSDYTDGKLYTFDAGPFDRDDYDYFFLAKDEVGDDATGEATASSSFSVLNRAPTLTWTGETNYTTDGLHPESGDTSTSFTFRVSYVDDDNDAPLTGYPRIVILKAGSEVLNETMTEVNSSDVDYYNGKLYAFSTVLTTLGTDYEYYFYAMDELNEIATGPATTLQDAPDVLATTGSIRGSVTDQDGNPLQGATVILYNSSGEEVDSKTTDSSGDFEFTGLDFDTYSIKATKEGYEDETETGIEVTNDVPIVVPITLNEEVSPEGIPMWIWAIIILLVALLVIALLLLTRKKKKEEEVEEVKEEIEEIPEEEESSLEEIEEIEKTEETPTVSDEEILIRTKE